jgi:hypothetical protein
VAAGMTLLDMISHIHRQNTIARIQEGGPQRVAATIMAQAAVDNGRASSHILTPRAYLTWFCFAPFDSCPATFQCKAVDLQACTIKLPGRHMFVRMGDSAVPSCRQASNA